MRTIFNILSVLMLVATILQAPVAVQATATTAPEKNPLQFTSAGHVLAFSNQGIIVASSRHMLHAEFSGAYPVAPRADNSAIEMMADTMAAPLVRVTYRNLWDGVDLVYEADTAAILRSTYYLKESAAAQNIRLRYNHPLQMDDSGNLLIAFNSGTMVDSAPVAWQETGAGRHMVQVSYTLYNDRELGFTLGKCIPGLPVVIDPWLTFLGSSGNDSGLAVTVDRSGNVYVTGRSDSTWGSPIRAYTASHDAFAAKLDRSGNLIWNTFLGGSGGDYGYAIAVDASNNVYVAGYSYATWGTPVRPYTTSSDGFAAKLDAGGNLIWNTFLGGSGGADTAYGIAIDSVGNVYVTGRSDATWGSPVRAFTAQYDAFAARLDRSGNLIWNTFLGGSDYDEGSSIVVDCSGNVYVDGWSIGSWGSPVRAYTYGFDGFAARLDADGNLVWNTFLGSSDEDIAYGIAVDGSGNLYLSGYSLYNWGTPVRAYTAHHDTFSAKLDADGNLIWNTFLGGSGNDFGFAIAVDGVGNVYVAGHSDATWSSPVRAYTADYDAFAARLDPSGNLIWNTFLGGNGTEYGRGIAVDVSGNIHVAGRSNATWGSPIRSYTADYDAFVVQLASNGEMRTYPVTYNGNGNTSGSAPAGQIKIHGLPLTLYTNTGGLARSGYAFSGWNTAADGTGTDYTAGANYTGNAPLTLFAKWIQVAIGTGTHGGFAPATTTTVNPTVPLPNIRIQSASLSSEIVAPGTPVTVTATINNQGTLSGSKKVTLYVNGQVEATRGITVKSGDSLHLTFDLSRNQPGEYTVYVENVPAGKFIVEGRKESDFILLVSITMLAAAFVIGIIMLRRKQREY